MRSRTDAASKSSTRRVVLLPQEDFCQATTRLPREFPEQIAETILSGTAAAARLLGEQLAKVR